ncbi:MAG: MSMEG_4193 family putative phosphomutase [Myxococcales bacterium]|nr:MAG: MSMEG_4193 family putative phosphomutase [Myxococcales bacterium]
MAILVLARHGRTAANASGVLAGRSPGVHLDDVGREQAAAAAERLTGVPLAAAVTSPLERCRETAAVLLRGSGVRARVDKSFTECDYGDWTGEKLSTLSKRKLWRTVQSQPSAAAFPGGESLAAMSARAVAGVRRHDAAVTEAHGADAVWLAVSHGDVIKAILADALGMHLDSFQRLMVGPASLSVVRYTPHGTFVESMNSTSGSLSGLARARKAPVKGAVVGGDTGTS